MRGEEQNSPMQPLSDQGVSGVELVAVSLTSVETVSPKVPPRSGERISNRKQIRLSTNAELVVIAFATLLELFGAISRHWVCSQFYFGCCDVGLARVKE
jgi:hypothetical protein